ncbi:hypothetical protein Droror1_Dr00005031 [Drosera rotundifolia]
MDGVPTVSSKLPFEKRERPQAKKKDKKKNRRRSITGRPFNARQVVAGIRHQHHTAAVEIRRRNLAACSLAILFFFIVRLRNLRPRSSSMAGNPNCTVYIGNLDERVTDRVLYDILIQAGRVVDLHMPRDRETNKLKGFAFAEYETDEIADYAVRLFSGLVILYNKTLKFQISGKDKPLPNMVAATNSSHMYAPHGSTSSDNMPTHPNKPLSSSRFSPYSRNSGQGREPNGNISRLDGHNFDYARRVFGASFERVTSSRSTRYDSSNPISFPSI